MTKCRFLCAFFVIILFGSSLFAEDFYSTPAVTDPALENHAPVPPKADEINNFQTHESTPATDKDNHFFAEFMNMLFTLGLIIVVILIVSWFFKRMLNTKIQKINTTSLIKITERRSLTAKSTIYILDFPGKSIAIAETPTGITFLTDLPISDNDSNTIDPNTFNKILEEKLKKNES